MPTNLPPEYYDAEERYRQAETQEERIRRLEELISTVPKHKGTDHLRADLRRKLSKMKEAAEKKPAAARQVSPYQIDREGAGQVVIAGPPNTGKSALLAALTNAEPEVEPFPYSTWGPTPGMMPVENVQIQLIDTPPLNEDHVEPHMMDLIRRADLLLLVIDLQGYPLEQIEEAAALLETQHIAPAHRREEFGDDLRWRFVPTLVVVNKVDDESLDEDYEVLCELVDDGWPLLPISVETGRGLEAFKWTVFERLGIIRVYSKPPNKEADLTAPFVLKKGSTVEVFAGKVHQDFVKELKSARIWGTGVYDGQMVGRDHVLHDGDVVELRV
ncbi:MAG: TGS domain-containing protein [Candidatus Promineifilaceae bacterium]|nr:TGS domain-containing protein [Candidatus Promineifilaceae bacterium]